MYLLVPYRRRRSPGRMPTRELVIQGVAPAVAGVAPWDEVEVLGGHAIVLVAPHVDAAARQALAGEAGVFAFPDIGLMGRLGDALSLQDRRVIREAIESLGYTRAEVVAAIGLDPATARLGDVLALIGSRRRKPRYDEASDTVAVDGDVLPLARPIPGFAAGGGPPTVLDTFDRADAADLGTGWTVNPFADGAQEPEIVSNAAAFRDAYCQTYYDVTTFAANQESWLEVGSVGTGTEAEVYLTLSLAQPSSVSATADGYQAQQVGAGAGGLDWIRVDNAVGTVLGATDSVTDLANGDLYRATRRGSTLQAWRNNATYGASRTDASYGVGYIGFGGYEAPTPGQTFLAFGGGSLGAGPRLSPAQRRFQHLLVR